MENNNIEIENKPKTALIVGASSGIGYHLALKLLESGYNVYNASRTENRHSRIKNLTMDVEKATSVSTAFSCFKSDGTGIDLLVYCAGYSMAAPVERAKMKDVYKLFDVNYFGALRVLQHAIPLMRKGGGGRIILVSSMAAEFPIAFDSFYSSSKAALDMLSKGLNMELEPYNIKVTSVQPGGTRTRFTYKRNVYPENTAGEYYDKLEKAVAHLEKVEQSGMTPQAVAESIISIIDSTFPPEVTACGFMNKTAKIAHKILPDRLYSYINKNQYLSE